MKILSKPEYLEQLDSTRDQRIAWWREARFGMFVHIGLYSSLGRNEWAMAFENWPIEEYEKLADRFTVKEGSANAWAALAKESGMKYMVLTTRHHDGFSLWDSKANLYNSVNYGPKRDIVKEYVDACRTHGLGIGFYSSLMDWHHPDGGRAAYDSAARKRFQDYLYAINEELLTNYGKIDILWYDVPCPMEHHEGWNSLEMNQRLRAIQPHIIINDRCHLPEDFGTPEGHLTAEAKRDWEACMTFNGISWGYVDSAKAIPYSYNAQRIIKMLSTVSADGGNLLLNIGPAPDGSVPEEAIEPLKTVGQWLAKNGDATYGKLERVKYRFCNGVCSTSKKGHNLYVWNWIWPNDGEIILGGFTSRVKSVHYLDGGKPIAFEQRDWRIFLKNLATPDSIAGVAVIVVEFEKEIEHTPFPITPSLNNGQEFKEPTYG
ncbi:MAG: alpha-L-fucosidase [Defluviitaleaceae bacterium]|nr:alpha-L-fucosidase [Defluviitaleaceae bacterium]